MMKLKEVQRMNNEKPIDSFSQFQKELDTLIKTSEKVLYHSEEYLRDPSEKKILMNCQKSSKI